MAPRRYYVQPGTSTLAATGTDATLTVNLGKQSNTNTVEAQVFTIKAASPLPTGITTITVTASLVADPTTGLQPINDFGFANVGNTARNNPINLTAGQKRSRNLAHERRQTHWNRLPSETGDHRHVLRIHGRFLRVYRPGHGHRQLELPRATPCPCRRSASISWSRCAGVVSGLMMVTRRAPMPSRLKGTM